MKVAIVLNYRGVQWVAPDWFVEKLRAEFPNVEFDNRRSYDDMEDAIRDADVLVTPSIRPEQIQPAKKLRWIQSTTAGVNQFLFPEIVNSDIILTNASRVHGHPVAEHVIALMFAVAKRIPSAVHMQQKHVWGKNNVTGENTLREIRGSNLLILGLGSIGGEVAHVASALGMNVIGIRANPQKGIDWLLADDPARLRHEVHGPDKLLELLPRADFVVIAAPVIGATTHLIDAEALARMKSDAYLINVARGALIHESALIEALKRKKIAGAALDVFETEPLPPESPLWDLENVLITPHQAGFANRLWERLYALFRENLHRFLDGKPLLGIVNKKAGY